MTHTPLIDRWSTLAEFAEDIGVSYGTAKAMRRRGSIPSEYWTRAVAGAEARGIDGITLETLAEIAARKAEAAA
jgi:hypothetical protein